MAMAAALAAAAPALAAPTPPANLKWTRCAVGTWAKAILLLALACTTTSAFDPCDSAAGCLFDRSGASRCTFSPGVITDPHGQANQRVNAADGGGMLSTDNECAMRAKVEHPAATGATFAVAGTYAGQCYAAFGTVRDTDCHKCIHYDSCLFAAPTASAPAHNKVAAFLRGRVVIVGAKVLVPRLVRPDGSSSNDNTPSRRVPRQTTEECPFTDAPSTSPSYAGWGGGFRHLFGIC